ncbi:TetR/AcrR family transcriptional regulator [Cellulomonas hominis]|uniref:TetR/AcrR family transcriptional regulator n=1 Tax=Cellulomonas hominis TaxID=156981 RepID=UPI001BCAE0D0|nr:TetR/AcrR family transcriptional regulator [Cellulomonas hominis]
MSSKPGQGRKFDLDDVLDAALRLFWRHGYDGVGVARLAQAMDISVSSLYAAFGSKQGLFLAAVEHYQSHYGNFAGRAFASSSGVREFGTVFLDAAAKSFTADDLPKGCFVISSSTSLSPEASELAARISRMRNDNLEAITAHLRESFGDELAAAGVDAEAVSRLLSAVVQGMSQQSVDGASAAQVALVARTAAGAIEAMLTV